MSGPLLPDFFLLFGQSTFFRDVASFWCSARGLCPQPIFTPLPLLPYMRCFGFLRSLSRAFFCSRCPMVLPSSSPSLTFPCERPLCRPEVASLTPFSHRFLSSASYVLDLRKPHFSLAAIRPPFLPALFLNSVCGDQRPQHYSGNRWGGRFFAMVAWPVRANINSDFFFFFFFPLTHPKA